VWQATVGVEAMHRVEVWNELMVAFMDHHRGYLLKELAAHAESVEHMTGMRNTGGFLFNCKNRRYGDFPETGFDDVVRAPHIIGLTREMTHESWGSWIGSLFLYQPPHFGFNRSEQRLLLEALYGGTDEDLSAKLGISLSAVKKTWLIIYQRAAACLSEPAPGNLQANDERLERGRDKKQRLIAYVREHREELRPTSRKLLRQNGAQGDFA
jgi:DNA-binding CsgD family transcriptional regulator